MTGCEKLKFGQNMDADGGFMRTKLGGVWTRDSNFGGPKSAKTEQN